MVITGGILALICPVEYYKRAEIPRYKNDIKAINNSAQNKAGTQHTIQSGTEAEAPTLWPPTVGRKMIRSPAGFVHLPTDKEMTSL